MAKSNRQRKLERAKRASQTAQQQVKERRRLVIAESADQAAELFGRVLDPATSPQEAGDLIIELLGDDPVPVWLVPGMAEQGQSADRIAAIASALLAGPTDGQDDEDDAPEPAVSALTFAAAAARLSGNLASSRELLDQALAVADADGDPLSQVRLIDHLRATGRVAEALSLFEDRLRADPERERLGMFHAEALWQAFTRVQETAPDDVGGCPCGLGASWLECCQPKERAALDRFGDRTALVALQEAVRAWLAAGEAGEAVAKHVTRALGPTDLSGWAPADRAELIALLTEQATLAAHRAGDDEADHGHVDEAGQEPAIASPLGDFAADPATPPELASRALAWQQHARYGLWRIEDTNREPGQWCTEISSGLRRYVEFPAELAAPPRWAAWLGAVIPVDGIWRCTGTGMRLSPIEADAAADFIYAATSAVLSQYTGKQRGKASLPGLEPMRFGQARPGGVLVERYDPVPPEVAGLMSVVTGELLGRIAVEVHGYRTAPPALRNADDDEMCLITAQIAVNDGARAAGRLTERQDFETADPADQGAITWYGQRIPDAPARALMAGAMSELGSQGRAEAELAAPDGAERWVRGTLRVEGNHIIAGVNSAERLAKLISVLERIEANPRIVEETRVDPAQDLAWPSGKPAAPGASLPPEAGWEKAWLDEPVPALRGRTPRQAVAGDEWPLLEALLRQWEYEADLLAAQGKRGVDTDWLRQELKAESGEPAQAP